MSELSKNEIEQATGEMQCEHEGCDQKDNLTPCFVYDPDTGELVLDSHYCWKHSYENGFCRICGQLWAGVESFEFNNPLKLCENCKERIECEIGETDEEPDEVYYPEGW